MLADSDFQTGRVEEESQFTTIGRPKFLRQEGALNLDAVFIQKMQVTQNIRPDSSSE